MVKQDEIALAKTELGKKSYYDSTYDAKKLLAIPRAGKRKEIGIEGKLPFFGQDIWNHYEVSWLNEQGKPIVALAEIIYGCDSPNIVESKSLKLYFNSFNNSQFKDAATVESLIKKDLEAILNTGVAVKIISLSAFKEEKIARGFDGVSLDDLPIICDVYEVDASLLKTEVDLVEETLHSDLLKSNCLVTGQPDWGSVQITYKGKKINHESLLKYIVSFRNHTEFGEHCSERIFMDICKYCQPKELIVNVRYTRRGGIDINFCRATKDVKALSSNVRLCRQ